MSNKDPVAWIAFATDGSEISSVYSLYEQARAAADEWNWDVAPLYAGLTLTDEEREAVKFYSEAGVYWSTGGGVKHARTLLGLLHRTK
jgi:hypothetical protein